MGVSVLVPCILPQSKSLQACISELKKGLAVRGAIETDDFYVECDTYGFAQDSQKKVHLLSASEYPTSIFSILQIDGRILEPVVAEKSFHEFLVNYSSFCEPKKRLKIMLRGARYVYHDFLVKLGVVSTNDKVKGVLLELDYQACSMPAFAWKMILEALETLFGVAMGTKCPDFFKALGNKKAKMYERYDVVDTMVQYMKLFTIYHKQTTIADSDDNPDTEDTNKDIEMVSTEEFDGFCIYIT